MELTYINLFLILARLYNRKILDILQAMDIVDLFSASAGIVKEQKRSRLFS